MDDVEKIKQKIDIVELINERVPLKKAGRNFKALCPFHSEKTSSFVVSPERQIFHCFGCGKSGDIFQFLIEYENLTFPESLKDLADRAGVKLTRPVFQNEKEKKRETIYALNHLASQFYNYLLLSHPAGKHAFEYLTSKRKLTVPLIKTFNLGFAPGNDALVKYLVNKKRYSGEDLITAGLAFRRGREVSDFFKNRIIFPIIDARGNVIAFSGRGLDENTSPKYVNTRETPVYIKGDTLFGLDKALEAIKKEGKAIIVEGEFDVITAHKNGIANIVAVKGTALTQNQIKLLKRFTNKFALCFDTDVAGTEAQRRSIREIEKEGISITVVQLRGTRGDLASSELAEPAKPKDPDELLNENPILFKKALRDDTNVYDYIIDSAAQEFDRKSAEGKKNILEKTLPYIADVENEVIKEHFLKKLAGLLDTTLEALSKQADKTRSSQDSIGQTPKLINPQAQLPREEVVEIYLLSLIFQSASPKDSLAHVRAILEGTPLSTSSLEKLLSYLSDYKQRGPSFDARDFVKFLPEELHVPFDTSFLAPIPEFSDQEHFFKEVEKTAKQAKIFSVKKALSQLSNLIGEAENEKNDEKLKNLQEKFSKLSKSLAPN